MFYLLDHPNPSYAQVRATRRNGARVSGTFVIHTAENAPDWTPPDTGAESVARFIATRKDPGSYHRLVDSDSAILMAPIDAECWHDTRTNNWSTGYSFATTAARWPDTPQWWRDQAIARMADVCAADALVLAGRGIAVPARLITRAEALARKPGFIGHGMIDTARRTDPGPAFPWDQFLAAYAAALAGQASGHVPAAPSWTPAVLPELINQRLALAGFPTAGRPGDYDRAAVAAYQRAQLYPRLVPDGLWGPKTEAHFGWTVELQMALASIGGHLAIDGSYMRQTKLTTRNGQIALGLAPTGEADAATCRALGIRSHP